MKLLESGGMFFRILHFCIEIFGARKRLVAIIPRVHNRLGDVAFIESDLNILELNISILGH